MANPTSPKPPRRFAPIPIETTFEQFRKSAGPTAEPTPSPSPTSPMSPALPPPPPRGKRRFAPQLVESSVRRSRRAGDEGPATRPTDRTDITPYTKHIYAPKSKKKHGQGQGPVSRRMGHARRESCDDEIAEDVFDLVARDAQLKLQEVAMSAFPNSGIRIGGAEHFYVREGSDDDSLPSRGRPTIRGPGGRRTTSRRDSSEEDTTWAFKEMREHHHVLEHARERVSTLDLDNMSIDGPPSDAMGLTRAARESLSGSPLWARAPSSGSLGPIGEGHMPLLRADSPLPTIGESVMSYGPPESPRVRPIGEYHMPYIPSAGSAAAANMPRAPASQVPPETGFRSHASPFRKFAHDRDMSLERARNLHRLKNHSPPMLGKELTFRTCPSPKHTKLEPDHLWDLETGATWVEPCRDPSEEKGLWRGYCFASTTGQQLAVLERQPMVSTPFPPSTPGDPFSSSFNTAVTGVTDEPTTAVAGGTDEPTPDGVGSWYRARSHEPKGLHMLQGLEDRLRKAKENVEREERIAAEFDDTFVTQVYNYLSLGYPASARAYDEELSKISRIGADELERDDAAIMDKPTGHIMLDREEKQGVSEDERCPRWKALKLYIFEWARQHPDLNAISPLAWGVRERRGSWGI